MQKVNLERLQEEARERHRYKPRKTYTKKTWFEKTFEKQTKAFLKQIRQEQNSIYGKD